MKLIELNSTIYCSIIFVEAGSASVPRTPADSAKPHQRHHHSLIYISCYQSLHLQKLISVFPHRKNVALVK
jgi:hypothetical protein